jgi:hypothetical protein
MKKGRDALVFHFARERRSPVDCVHCEGPIPPERDDSRFCSQACKEEYSRAPPELVTCSLCDSEIDGLQAAKDAGWEDLIMDVEGSSWNYLGICPECVLEEAKPDEEG